MSLLLEQHVLISSCEPGTALGRRRHTCPLYGSSHTGALKTWQKWLRNKAVKGLVAFTENQSSVVQGRVRITSARETGLHGRGAFKCSLKGGPDEADEAEKVF